MPTDTIISDETLADFGFSWRDNGVVRVLVCRPLEDAGFANGFSTRPGGVSEFPAESLNLAGFDEDDAANIYENRRRFLAVFGRYELATVWQVHGDAIRLLADDDETGDLTEKADAVISDRTGVLAGVKTADCVPVLLGDPTTGAFAAVHAGWRGTSLSVTEKAVSALVERFGTDASHIVAAIGPAAGCSRYEVGADVIEAFAEGVPESSKYFERTREGHALVDLARANRDQLLRAGVAETSIFTAPFCTMERNDLFFSYRLEKRTLGRSGRMLSVIGRRQ